MPFANGILFLCFFGHLPNFFPFSAGLPLTNFPFPIYNETLVYTPMKEGDFL